MNDRLKIIMDTVKEKEEKRIMIKEKYKDLDKKKKLTVDQRLDRIEELLGIK